MGDVLDIQDALDKIQTAPNKSQLTELNDMVGRATSLAAQLASLDDLTKSVKAEYRDLTEKVLPDAMASAGTAEFKTIDGVVVTIKDFVNGSLPKDTNEREAAISWLTNNGAGDLVKDTFTVPFAKGEADSAADLRDELLSKGFTFNEKEDVHPQTLAAFARERLRNGEPLPLDLLGLYAGRVAKIKMP